jgi:aspartate carbamoyltransferase catalytic subunit
MRRLGGEVIGFAETASTSMQKGESLHDAMRVMGSYSDIIVIRHPEEGAAALAASATETPVINAGDGTNEHPTQMLLDLFTIQECQQRLENLHIACVGDLLHSRTIHSLCLALPLFGATISFVSPPSLAPPPALLQALREAHISFACYERIEEVIDRIDILYMTRIQKERFSDAAAYERVKDRLIVTPELLSQGKQHLKVLHPLPRLNEIVPTVDKTSYAYYFQQAENGLYVRQALLALLLGR